MKWVQQNKTCELSSFLGQGCKHIRIQNTIHNIREIKLKASKYIRGLTHSSLTALGALHKCNMEGYYIL